MLLAARSTLVFGALALLACGSKAPPAESAPAASEPPAPVAPAGKVNDAKRPEALVLESPVSGPAVDTYPPLPMRPVEQERVDFRTLSEAPRLVVDTFGHASKVKSLEYTHDGRSLVSVGYDKTIRVWSAKTGELERTLRGEIGDGPAGRLYAASLSPTDDLLAVGGFLGKSAKPSSSSYEDAYEIRVLDYRAGTTLRLLSGHSDVVLDLAFAHSGERLVSAGADGSARLWDARTGASLHTLRAHSGRVLTAAWAPDDLTIVTGGSDRTVRLWDSATGSLLATLEGHTDGVTAVAFTKDNRRLVTGSADRTLRVWDARAGKGGTVLAKLPFGVGSLTLGPASDRVLVTPSEAPFESRVYSIPEGRLVATYAGHDNVVLASAISPNGKWAATIGGSDFGLSVWDITTGRGEFHAAGHGAAVWNVGFGSDENTIAWGHTYQRVDGASHQLNGALENRLRLVQSRPALELDRDAQALGPYVRAEEQARGLLVRTPNGREHETLEVWEGATRRASITRDSTSGYTHLAYSLSRASDVVVSGGENGSLVAYDARYGTKLREFVGHTGDVLAVAISPNGQRVVSGSSDQTVRVWDMDSGALLLSLFHARNDEWVAFTSAGYFASSVYGDGYLGWHVNRGADKTASFISASTFERRLRFESVVIEYVRTRGDLREAVRIANTRLVAGATPIPFYRFEDLPQFAPPQIYHMKPGLDFEVTGDRFVLVAEAYSPTDEPITDMEVLVNGRPLDPRWLEHAGRPKLKIEGRYAHLEATVPLPERTNRISVVAKNQFATGSPARVDVTRKGGPGPLEKLYQPNLFLLSIGISDYQDKDVPKSAYANADAKAIERAFKTQNRSLYGKVESRVLLNEQATKDAVQKGLGWLSEQVTQKDVTVLYLAGHAARDALGEYYFLPRGGDHSRLSTTAIAWSDIRRVLERLPGKVILLADTCHAGAIGRPDDARYSPYDLSRILERDAELLGGAIVMTAASGTEMSYESGEAGHGAFTRALLEGLAGEADYDRDEFVYGSELAYYVRYRVPALTQYKQHPTTQVPRSMPNFALAERSKAASSPKRKSTP